MTSPRLLGASRSTATRPRDIIAWNRTPLVLAIAGLTFMNVSRAHYMAPWIARLHPGQVLFALSIAALLVQPRRADARNLVRTWPAKALFVFAALAVTSTLFGISVGGAAKFMLESYSRTLLVAGMMLVAMRSLDDLSTIVWSVFWGCCVLAYQAIFVFGLETNAGFSRLGSLYDMDPNDIGCVLAIGLPLSLVLLQNSRRALKPVIILMMLGMMATVARSGSRGTFVALLVMGLMLLVLARGVSVMRRAMIVVGAGVALAFAAPPGYWKQMGTITDLSNDYNITEMDGRKELIRRGIGYAKMYPVFGLGISNFQKAECQIIDARREAVGDTPNCTAPHNSLVQVTSELGFAGGVLWVAVLIGGVVSLLRLRGRVPDAWRKGAADERYLFSMLTFLPVAIIGFAISSLFVSFAWATPIYLLIALMAVTMSETRRRLPRRGLARR